MAANSSSTPPPATALMDVYLWANTIELNEFSKRSHSKWLINDKTDPSVLYIGTFGWDPSTRLRAFRR